MVDDVIRTAPPVPLLSRTKFRYVQEATMAEPTLMVGVGRTMDVPRYR